jgi:hypothetical protein
MTLFWCWLWYCLTPIAGALSNHMGQFLLYVVMAMFIVCESRV